MNNKYTLDKDAKFALTWAYKSMMTVLIVVIVTTILIGVLQ